MSAPKNIEGTYKIFYMAGCLTGMHPERPLTIMGFEFEHHQVWEVKRQGNDEYMIVLKRDPKMGATYPKELHPTTPVMLGEQPRKFKVMPMEGRPEHFLICPAEEGHEHLVMAMSPALIYPPMVAMMPRDIPFIWRFERA